MARLTPREEAVMTLWDSGLPAHQIAATLSLGKVTVEKIIRYFGPADEQRRQQVAMVAASARLASAIHQARSI